MYGREFGKSLCHAWGASPIYLLGKYYLGVRPLYPGYATYEIKPQLGGLEWMEGDVPTPKGKIHLYVSKKQMRIKADEGKGTVLIASKKIPVCKNATVATVSKGVYSLAVAPNAAYEITYEAP